MSSPRPSARQSGPFGQDLDRRDFLKICTAAAAAVGLPAAAGWKMAEAVAAGKKPSVIWLSLQECTGCTESLLRTSHPGLDELVLDLISLDYHETLLAPSGHAAEECRRRAMEEHAGSYILVVEGAVPTAAGGVYCRIGGQTALELLRETAAEAGAIIAIGSCASWGGIPSAHPNPTGAKGAPEVLTDRTVVSIPGCPANPYNFLGTALQYATFGTLPELDEQGRPRWAYGRTIHETCPRRADFDAGRFAETFGDEGHRKGWCLYKLGCKGPATHANCSTQHFAEVTGAWPIGLGHPCFGCTEAALAFSVPLHTTVGIDRPLPADAFPTIFPDHERGRVRPLATGIAGLAVGGALGAAYGLSRRLSQEAEAGAPAVEEEKA